MSFDPIRFLLLPICAPLATWPTKVAGELGLGAVAEFFATPAFVLCVAAMIEALARRQEGRWTGLGLPSPLPGVPSRAPANALRLGRSYGSQQP